MCFFSAAAAVRVNAGWFHLMSSLGRPGQATRRPLTSAVLRPCSPLLSDSVQRARSQPLAFAATTGSGGFGFREGHQRSLVDLGTLRPKTRSSPTAGVLKENSRAESCAADLERALRKDADVGQPAAEPDRPGEAADVLILRHKFQED